jgi:general secretion pathway protein G
MLLSDEFETPQGRRAGPALPDAFSLLEMMVVIDLILVLATFALPIYQSIIVHGRETVLREDLFTLRSQIDQFTHDNARAPASLQELVDKGYMGAVPVDPMTGSSDSWQLDTETEKLSAVSSQLSATAAPLGIADVHSGAEGKALDGTDYGEW